MYQISTRQLPSTNVNLHSGRIYDSTHNKHVGRGGLAHFGLAPLEIWGGLRTPPADDMAATYQSAPYRHGNYDPRSEVAYQVAASYVSSAYSGEPLEGRASYPSQSSSQQTMTSITSYSRPASPKTATATHHTLAPPADDHIRRRSTSNAILPNMQIPASINNSGGSLAEFAAEITCLFWFEPTETLHRAERMSPSSSPIKRLRDEALPSTGFRKWVVTILSTTQVTQNVVLLALLFIYRLKTINPAVKGRSGSEYRLLTVALMLGNKFLDDNTYTNKTWAEVSGISVTEIHVMEVEFLSNMRYSLLASESQWAEWQKKLSKFWDYCEAASTAPIQQASPPLSIPALQSAIPSPSSTSIQASSPSRSSMYISASSSMNYNQVWPANAPNFMAPISSPLHAIPDLNALPASRKRSYGGDLDEPLPKRVTRSASSISYALGAVRHDVPRLPVPNLTISTSQPPLNGYTGSTNFTQNMAPHLPPISGRVMPAVYPQTPSWAPQLPLLPPNQVAQHVTPNSIGYTTPSRKHSPRSVQELLSIGSSPISASFQGPGSGYASPSFFQQRSSPYRPVRNVNTLLYPPPSASMHDYSTNADQMHYQPLGKRNDYRSGVVPTYSSQTYQWPVLPQPQHSLQR